MHSGALLKKVLKAKGIEDITQLSDEDKVKYDDWQRILSEGEITVEKIEQFLANQIKWIEAQWLNLDNTSLKNDRLIVFHGAYSLLLRAIKAPEQARKQVEYELNNLLKQKS